MVFSELVAFNSRASLRASYSNTAALGLCQHSVERWPRARCTRRAKKAVVVRRVRLVRRGAFV
jgi:hypothetical protein